MARLLADNRDVPGFGCVAETPQALPLKRFRKRCMQRIVKRFVKRCRMKRSKRLQSV